jgi:SAM-dependent methyltransferase
MKGGQNDTETESKLSQELSEAKQKAETSTEQITETEKEENNKKLNEIKQKKEEAIIQATKDLEEKTRIERPDDIIKTMNETSFMFMLAVPTTASLSTRCIHVLNYIKDTDNNKYEDILQNAIDFYSNYKDKDDTLKKPIKGDKWVDFVVNVLYWWPPTMASVKLIRQINDIYHPGDIVFIGLNCDRNAPSFENTFDRYAYMLDHPSTTSHEALWQDERVCAAAFFAQNEAAFILAKMYSKYIISIGESKPGSFMVNRIDYQLNLQDHNSILDEISFPHHYDQHTVFYDMFLIRLLKKNVQNMFHRQLFLSYKNYKISLLNFL